MPPAFSAARAGVMPKASGDPSSRTFGKDMKTANPPDYTFKSHLRLYWILWLSYLGVCFILWSTPRYFSQPFRSNLPVIYTLERVEKVLYPQDVV